MRGENKAPLPYKGDSSDNLTCIVPLFQIYLLF